MNWLCHRCPGSAVQCKKADPDPPDFWLWQNDCKYAVEITKIQHQKDTAWRVSQDRFVKEVQKEARAQGILRGLYEVVFVTEPDPDPKDPNNQKPTMLDTPEKRTALMVAILEFVRKTKSDATTHAEHVRLKGHLVCRIQKHASEEADIVSGDGGIEIDGWEPDIRLVLSGLLERRLEAKLDIPPNMNCPTILVLHDLYRLANEDMVRQCLHGPPEIKLFHTVYVVQERNVGFHITTSFPSRA